MSPIGDLKAIGETNPMRFALMVRRYLMDGESGDRKAAVALDILEPEQAERILGLLKGMQNPPSPDQLRNLVLETEQLSSAPSRDEEVMMIAKEMSSPGHQEILCAALVVRMSEFCGPRVAHI